MPKKTLTAEYILKYDCKNSRRYTTSDENFPIKDVYVQRPWSNDIEKFELEIVVAK